MPCAWKLPSMVDSQSFWYLRLTSELACIETCRVVFSFHAYSAAWLRVRVRSQDFVKLFFVRISVLSYEACFAKSCDRINCPQSFCTRIQMAAMGQTAGMR